MVTRDILFRFLGDSRQLQRASRDAASAMSPLQKNAEAATKRLSGLAKAATIAGAAFVAKQIVDFGKAAVDAASDLEESVNAVTVVFGDAAGIILDFSDDAASAVGLAASEFNQLATGVGSLLRNYGFAANEAAAETINLTTRAADMASVFNTDVSDALGAIEAAIRGESEPIRRFGVSLSDVAVRAKAVELGLADTAAEVDEAGKAAARVALIYEQTERVAGDFANTSDSLANRQRILAAEWENQQAVIGQKLVPVAESLLSAMKDLMPVIVSVAGAVADFVALAGRGVEAISALFGSQEAQAAIRYSEALEHVNTALERGEQPAAEYADGLTHLAQSGALTESNLESLGASVEFVGEQQAVAIAEALEWARANGVAADQVEILEGALRDQIGALDRSESEIAALQRRYGVYVESAEEAAGATLGYRDAAVRMAGVVEREAVPNIRDHANRLSDLEQRLLDAKNAQESLTDVMRSAVDPVFAANRALRRHSRVLEEISDPDSPGGAGHTAQELLDLADAKLDVDAAFERLSAANGVQNAIGALAQTLGISRDKTRDLLVELGILDGKTFEPTVRIRFVTPDTINIGGTTVPVYVTGGGQVVLHDGGIVPGTRGQEVAAVLQAGERVISLREQEQAQRAARNGSPVTPMPSPGGNVHFNFAGPVVGGPQLVQEIREKLVLAQRRGATVAKV